MKRLILLIFIAAEHGNAPARMDLFKYRPPQPSTSLIFTLPPELISSIFLFPYRSDREGYKELLIFLVRITAVCSTWREVALATPVLWTEISLRIYPFLGTRLNVLADIISAHLNRSQTAPLYLTLGNNSIRGSTYSTIFPLLSSHLQRCRDISVTATFHSAWGKMFPLRGRFDNLDSLTLDFSDSTLALKGMPLGLFASDVQALPELVHFSYRGPPLDSIFRLPGARLTHLQITFQELRESKEFARFLLGCPELETLSLSRVQPIAAPDPILLPSLKTLNATYLSSLRWLDAPRLQQLDLHDFEELTAKDMAHVPVSLRSLTLQTVYAEKPIDTHLLWSWGLAVDNKLQDLDLYSKYDSFMARVLSGSYAEAQQNHSAQLTGERDDGGDNVHRRRPLQSLQRLHIAEIAPDLVVELLDQYPRLSILCCSCAKHLPRPWEELRTRFGDRLLQSKERQSCTLCWN